MKARSAKQLIAYWANKRRGPQCKGIDHTRPNVQSSYIEDGTDVVVGSLLRGVLGIEGEELEAAIRWATQTDGTTTAPRWLGEFAELARQGGVLSERTKPVQVSRFSDGQRIKVRETNMWDDKDPDKVLTEGELAAMLGVSTDTVARMRKSKQGPPCAKVGGRYMYMVASVRKWWQEQEGDLQGRE